MANYSGKLKARIVDFVSWFPYVAGLVAGSTVRFSRWAWGMTKAGYLEGLGDELWLEFQKRQGI